MPAPTIEPTLRGPVEPLGQRDLPVGQRVWVHREGSWRPGVVLSAAGSAVMVRYRPTDARGTGVDTVTTLMPAASMRTRSGTAAASSSSPDAE